VASLAAGLAASVGIWIFLRRTPVDAAVELDRAFDLRERVSSTLTLPDELRTTPAGSALIADACKRVEAVDVRERFGIEVPRTAWLPLVPGILVFVVATFVDLGKSDSVQAKTAASSKEREQVQKSTKVLSQRLEKQKQEAKEQGLEETRQQRDRGFQRDRPQAGALQAQ
jgi:hypothetical protein